jgi:uncharacterized protein (TIGR03086 family)
VINFAAFSDRKMREAESARLTPLLTLDDHVAAFDGAIAAFNSALDSAKDTSQPVTLPFGTMPGDVALRIAAADLLVHSWDLARATGQRVDAPKEFVEAVTPFFQEFVGPELRDGDLFAQAVEPREGATPLERLANLAGRQSS